MGEKNAALAEAQRATELLPESKDAFGGPEIAAGVAEVYTILGDNDRAIRDSGWTVKPPECYDGQGLKMNPIWDRLRGDPRFQALLQKYGGKA